MKKLVTTTSHFISGLLLLMTSGVLTAQTITLSAVADFPSITDGEVPYEVNTENQTLAIDATIPEFRELFARASTSFTGPAGNYDITLNTLGEAAGDSRYRVMVNGVIVGAVTNDPVVTGSEEQVHSFTGIFIPPGATLSVESNAVTNGLLSEGEEFSYASGQWQSLTLQNNNPEQLVDLSVDAEVLESDLRAGDEFTLQIGISNNSETQTATGPLVFIQVPPTVEFSPPAECILRSASTTLTCDLAEIGPQQIQAVSLPGLVNATGQIMLEVTASADQNDSDLSNNQALAILDTRDPNVPSSVDLFISASASTDELEIGTSVTYTVSATNIHATTVATSPVVEVVLPSNLQFDSSADCTVNEEILRCSLSELTPGMTDTAEFSATVIDESNAELMISASAAEIEEQNADNELALPVNVLSIGSAQEQPEAEIVSGIGGGGSLSLLLLLPFIVVRRFRGLYAGS